MTMKTLSVKRNKSFEWSFGLHAGILVLGLLPFAHQVMEEQPVEYQLEIGYLETPEEVRMSGSRGLEARSPVYHEEPEPTMDQPAEEPIPVEDIDITEQPTIAENHAEVVSEVMTEEAETQVTASESTASGNDAETHANGGGDGSPIEGNQDGAAMAGDGGAGDGLEGDGVITRRIIHREDITQVAKVNGRIVLNLCIDRQGKVVSVSNDVSKSTITDRDLLKHAMYLAAHYQFENNYNAPPRECGQLTFIFSIEEEVAVK
jgi:hypothetical protein